MKINNENFLLFLYERTFEILENSGSKGWTMEDVCKAAGISKDTLYRAVSGKEDLITRAIKFKIASHISDMKRITESDFEYYTRFNRMLSLLHGIIESFSSKQLQSVLRDYPISSHYTLSEFSNLLKILELFLQQGIDKGLLRPELDASFLATNIHYTVLYIIERESPKNYERHIESYLDILMNGIKSIK